MAAPTIVFVHGRGQEFKDPAGLMRKWLAALNAGLTRADMAAVTTDDIVFPYYGDLLYRANAASADDRIRLESLEPGEAGPFHPDTAPDVGDVERQLLADMLRHAGVPARVPDDTIGSGSPTVRPEGLADRVLSWKAARDLLTVLARRTRVDQLIIQAQLRDVATYLTRAREAVLDLVRDAIPESAPLVLVSHSLGTVVARDLLDDDSVRNRTELWVTTGSPLGLEAVQRNLLSPGCLHPRTPWVSAFDTNDVVALGHPLHESWGDPLTDLDVENGNDPHSISQYLSHPEVARPVGEAFMKLSRANTPSIRGSRS